MPTTATGQQGVLGRVVWRQLGWFTVLLGNKTQMCFGGLSCCVSLLPFCRLYSICLAQAVILARSTYPVERLNEPEAQGGELHQAFVYIFLF